MSDENENADLKDNWRNSIADEDMRANKALANFDTLDDAIKGYIDLKSYQGNSLHIPGEDTNEEQRAEFANKLVEKVPSVMLRPDPDNADQTKEFYRSAGMPEESSGYEAPEVELPDGMKKNEDRLEFFKGLAHESGLNKSQFKKIMEGVEKADIETTISAQESHQKATDALNTEWGAAADERKQAALNIAEKTGAPESLVEAIKSGTVPPELTKWIYGLSTAIGSEGTNLANNQQTKPGKMTPDEAKDKIAEIYANKEHPFHKSDLRAQKKMLELVVLANPGASSDVNELRTGTSFSV